MHSIRQTLSEPHLDKEFMRAALLSSEAVTGFSARLIEKDYYCSLVLRNFAPLFALGVVFKGGTAISKVHCAFRRLSEDLDFTIPVPWDIGRPERRRKIEPVKRHLDGLVQTLSFLKTETPLTGHDEGRHYTSQLVYSSVITSDPGRIKIEFGIREPLEDPAAQLDARTLLVHPLSGSPSLPPVSVSCLTLRETYAEKWRAALTRQTPAIRDYYDISDAFHAGILQLEDVGLHTLIKRKLGRLRGPLPVFLVSAEPERHILKSLRPQMDAGLRPVLRQADYEKFNLNEAVGAVLSVYARVRDLADGSSDPIASS